MRVMALGYVRRCNRYHQSTHRVYRYLELMAVSVRHVILSLFEENIV